MPELIGQIDRIFQRLLRWVYPPALFSTLLYLTRPDDFTTFASIEKPWGLIIASFVAGFAVYLFQNYFISQFIIFGISCTIGWEYKFETLLRFRLLQPLADLANKWAQVTYRRYGTSVERLNSYLDYAWAAYHATMVTGWLTLTLFFLKEQNSIFDSIPSWEIILPAALLILAGISYYGLLTRVTNYIPQTIRTTDRIIERMKVTYIQRQSKASNLL